MSIFSRLFGRKSDPAAAAPAPAGKGEEYKGFQITPNPIKESGQYRVAARIEKDGKTHELIRADTMGSVDQAMDISLAKARQIIDEQGERLFG